MFGLNLRLPRAGNLNRLALGQWLIGTSRFQFSKCKIQGVIPRVRAPGEVLLDSFITALRYLLRVLLAARLKCVITRRDPSAEFVLFDTSILFLLLSVSNSSFAVNYPAHYDGYSPSGCFATPIAACANAVAGTGFSYPTWSPKIGAPLSDSAIYTCYAVSSTSIVNDANIGVCNTTCPYGGTYIGIFGHVPTCSGAPSCPAGQFADGSGNCAQPFKNIVVGNSCPAPSSPFPISYANQNKFLIETDFRQGALAFIRTYNSQPLNNVVSTSLGTGWTSGFHQAIISKSTGVVIAVRPDGKTIPYTLTAGVWTADNDISEKLVQLTDATNTVTGWQFTTTEDDLETYDASGKLISIKNRLGLTQTYSYSDGTSGPNGGFVLDDNGNPTLTVLYPGYLLRITDSSGRSLNFGYNQMGHLVKMTDPATQTYLYKYDSHLNLSAVVYPDGKTKSYLYEPTLYTAGGGAPLSGIIDENGIRYATYRYDATGRAYDEDHGGSVDHYNLAYSVDGSGNPISTTVTDPLGTPRTYNFTTVLGVVKSTGTNQPGGSGCGAAASSVTYDANGNIASRTDFNGNQTTYLYDLTRNLETSRTEAAGTSLARTISTTWHPTFRLPTQITEPGRVTNLAYDATTGNLLSKSITDTVSNTTRT